MKLKEESEKVGLKLNIQSTPEKEDLEQKKNLILTFFINFLFSLGL